MDMESKLMIGVLVSLIFIGGIAIGLLLGGYNQGRKDGIAWAIRNANEEMADTRTAIQKGADWVAAFAGSITFLMVHVVWFGVWMTVNAVKFSGIPQFDPFPFGFLTLAVSLEAIFLSVFVLLSQNRQAEKDRVRSDIEYEINLKAELEIVQLHEKMDRLTSDVLLRLERLQQSSRLDGTR